MRLFGKIMDRIFHHGQAQAAPAGQAQAAPNRAPTQGQATAQAAPRPASAQGQAAQASRPAATPQAAPVDVEAVLTQMAANAPDGGGNWRTSIVDLLKLLDLDSSLDARKELAAELNVHVGADGSAEQNIALHKAVMRQLAANGGKVPETLKD
jgi:hypothetical protein